MSDFTTSLKTLFRRHPVLASTFTLSTLIAVFFATRFVISAVYWSMHANEPIRPWMTVGYIGNSWGVKPRAIDERAGLPVPEKRKPLTLGEIARQRGVPVEEIIADVEAAITELKAEKEAGGK